MANDSYNSYCFFFVFVVVACFIAALSFWGCHKSHVESIERILSCQEKQSAEMDSSLTNFHDKMKELATLKQEVMLDIVADPILRTLPKLTSQESDRIRKNIEAAIVLSTDEYLHKDAINEYESLILSNKWTQLQNDTRALLELEMNKVQNEYETLGVWAGILTIVFLIFSFYSLFKTDDLVKQGQEGLEKLNKIKRAADDKLDKLTLTGEQKFKAFDRECETLLKDSEDEIRSKLDGIEFVISRKEEILNRRLRKSIAEINRELENNQIEIKEYYNNTISEIQKFEELKIQLSIAYDKLEARLNLFEQKFNAVKMKMSESTEVEE